jgi:hypothetical protein
MLPPDLSWSLLSAEPHKPEHVEMLLPMSAIEQGAQMIVMQTTTTTTVPPSIIVTKHG